MSSAGAWSRSPRSRQCTSPLSTTPRATGASRRWRTWPSRRFALERNGGFSHGCNAGWRGGPGPLRPVPESRRSHRTPNPWTCSCEYSSNKPDVGAVAPRILHVRRITGLFAAALSAASVDVCAALFLHRVFPAATWTDELVRDPQALRSAEPRRSGCPAPASSCAASVLEELNGFDEGFFMYCEDIDLCRRSARRRPRVALRAPSPGRARGRRVGPEGVAPSGSRREPDPVCEEASQPAAALLERGGVALEALTHPVVSRGGRPVRAGHARSLRAALPRIADELAVRLAERAALWPNGRRHVARCPTSVGRAMCGICGVVQLRGEPRRSRLAGGARPDDGRDDASRPERPRHVQRAGRRARRPPAEHRRRRGRPPAVRERGRHGLGDPERRALQPCRRSATRPARGAATASRRRCDTEILPHLYEQHGHGVPGAAARHVRDRRLGRPRAARASSRATGSGSSRSTTRDADDLLVFASELKSLLASGLVEPELDYEAIDAYLTLGFVPGPRTPLAGVSQADARTPPRRRGRRRPQRARTGAIPSPTPVDGERSTKPASGCSRSSTSRCGCG